MSAHLHIPPFDPLDGLHIAKVENGGWVVRRSARREGYDSPIIAAFSTFAELLEAMAASAPATGA